MSRRNLPFIAKVCAVALLRCAPRLTAAQQQRSEHNCQFLLNIAEGSLVVSPTGRILAYFPHLCGEQDTILWQLPEQPPFLSNCHARLRKALLLAEFVEANNFGCGAALGQHVLLFAKAGRPAFLRRAGLMGEVRKSGFALRPWRGQERQFRRAVRLARFGLAWAQGERKVDAGVVEDTDRAEGDDQPFRDIVEGKADLETVLRHSKVPELMLQHNRHLMRIFVRQPFRKADAGCARIEGDQKMMIPRDAPLENPLKDAADHATEGVENQGLVSDKVFRHMPQKPGSSS